MSYQLTYIEEPNLEFRYGQKTSSPHDGLSVFGTYSADAGYHKQTISYAIVGTSIGIDKCLEFFEIIKKPIFSDSNERLWPTFPGFHEVTNSMLPNIPTRKVMIDTNTLVQVLSLKDGYKRVGKAVDLYLDALQNIKNNEEPVDIVFCIVPDQLFQVCRPESSVTEGIGYNPSQREVRSKAQGQMNIFDDEVELSYYQYSNDFRRQIKARAMASELPIQIIRESSLVPNPGLVERKLTPLTDRAWNLSVATYYKVGGKPWCLSDIRDGVCYIGLAYKLIDKKKSPTTACVAAQMFLRDGDGIVFRGDTGRWYSPDKKEFHLNKQKARDLIHGVINTYQELGGNPLKEVFIHSHSAIDKEEFEGFREACSSDLKVFAIRVRQDHKGGVRLYRRGRYPILRGSCLYLNQNQSLLWSTGYKPRLGSYDGWETPVPLSIDIQHGSSDIEVVSKDILSLTKLNFNTCKIGMAEPVTVGFSKMVGEILVSHKGDIKESPKFKFYM
jgi:hypothetical protein